jgi:hypothetical protein
MMQGKISKICQSRFHTRSSALPPGHPGSCARKHSSLLPLPTCTCTRKHSSLLPLPTCTYSRPGTRGGCALLLPGGGGGRSTTSCVMDASVAVSGEPGPSQPTRPLNAQTMNSKRGLGTCDMQQGQRAGDAAAAEVGGNEDMGVVSRRDRLLSSSLAAQTLESGPDHRQPAHLSPQEEDAATEQPAECAEALCSHQHRTRLRRGMGACCRVA